ncbi:EamA family transporter [Leucobacter denitrificans]|uniref:EamA family transporter n=1 Tax=Leucobacter denitrificans TaxID=683042 RepID=A0A7G9S3W9_9MICO|nr:EamA family transporter [Leucobacter denitrificans]QNN62544.1 EamA family transporter [Leucobacter denitrificans]
MTDLPSRRSATIRAMLLVLAGSAGMQIGAAVSLTLFDDLGPAGTSGLRLLIAGLLMVALFRPRLRGRSRAEWIGILLYGAAMAAMNLLLYQALERLPLGVATTLDFLGPCVVAFLSSRRLREGLLAIAAFTGVALMAGFGGPFDPIGLVWGVLAGASFAGYTLLAPRIGKSGGGMQSVALALVVAAVVTLPFSAPLLTSASLPQWGLLALSAVVGTAIPFVVDTIAGKLTSARVLGVFFAFDPVLGTLVGALFLGQVLTPIALLGIALVVCAGAGIVWLAGKHQEIKEPPMEPASESLEIERKYEVPADAEVPGSDVFETGGLSAGRSVTHELHARYFDTADGVLARNRFALRMRTGGSDAGWHLKEKGEHGTRELHWPISAELPAALAHELSERLSVDAADIAPLAELRTERRVMRLSDRNGAEVVELADDRVLATDLRGGVPVRRAWREWEAELMPGAGPEWLEVVERILAAAGATLSPSSAKIARATGSLIALAQSRGASEAEIEQLQEMDRLDQEAARRLVL